MVVAAAEATAVVEAATVVAADTARISNHPAALAPRDACFATRTDGSASCRPFHLSR